MKIESLDELRAAFVDWRSKKRHAREAVPEDLLERARRSIHAHGLGRVVAATKVDGSRLMRGRRGRQVNRKVGRPRGAHLPSFSRLEFAALSATKPPIAEVETPAGVKLRIFTETAETLDLLSSLCGVGGAR